MKHTASFLRVVVLIAFTGCGGGPSFSPGERLNIKPALKPNAPASPPKTEWKLPSHLALCKVQSTSLPTASWLPFGAHSLRQGG